MFSRIFTLLFLAQHILFLYPSEAKAETTCQAGYEWNTERNSCVLTQQSSQLLAGAQECAKKTTDEEKKKCYIEKGIAQDPTNDDKKFKYLGIPLGTLNGNSPKTFEYIYKASSLTTGLLNLKADGNKGADKACTPYSQTLINLAALTVGLGEIYTYFITYKKGIDTLHSTYQGLIESPGASAAQKQAFLYLADEQKLLAKVDKTRRNIYIGATSLYGLALIAAGIEMAKNKSNVYSGVASSARKQICVENEFGDNTKYIKSPVFKFLTIATGLMPSFNLMQNKKNENSVRGKNGITSINNYFKNIKFISSFNGSSIKNLQELNPYIEKSISNVKFLLNQIAGIQSVHAQEIPTGFFDMINEMVTDPTGFDLKYKAYQAKLEAEANAKKTELKNLNKDEKKRMILSGTMGLLSSMIATQSNQSKKSHEEREAALRTIASNFPEVSDDNLGICTESDRSDTGKKSCYCYIQENGVDKPNPERIKSQVCASLFNIKLDTSTSDYEKGKSAAGKICVDKLGNLDKDCRCKQLKDSKGNNACMKVPVGGGIGGTLTYQTAGLNMFPGANAVVGGDFENANLSTDSLGPVGNAVGLFAKKLDEDLIKNKQAPLNLANEVKKEFAKAIKLGQSLPSYNSQGTAGASSGTSLASVLPPKAMENIEKKAEQFGIKASELKSANPETAPTTAQSAANYDLGSANDAGTEELSMQGDVMAKNFNYGANDISKQQDENLFKVISNRYLQSGFKRLFEEIPKEESVTKPVDK